MFKFATPPLPPASGEPGGRSDRLEGGRTGKPEKPRDGR
jgi:hypothetical protein